MGPACPGITLGELAPLWRAETTIRQRLHILFPLCLMPPESSCDQGLQRGIGVGGTPCQGKEIGGKWGHFPPSPLCPPGASSAECSQDMWVGVGGGCDLERSAKGIGQASTLTAPVRSCAHTSSWLDLGQTWSSNDCW